MATIEGKLEDTFDRARGIPSRKSWRPEGWENPFIMRVSTDLASEWADAIQDLRLQAYETGADAILKALRHQKYSLEHIYDEDKRHKGVRVFIPDDNS